MNMVSNPTRPVEREATALPEPTLGAVTLFSSPDVLAKTWQMGADGRAVKTTAAQMWRGAYQVKVFEDAHQLAGLVGEVTTHQALSTSVPVDLSLSGMVTTRGRAEAGAVARVKENFAPPSGPGLLYLDHDAEPGKGGLSQADLWQLLLSVCPALAGAGVVWRPSGSSHIFDATSASAREVTGLKGQHLYVMLKVAADGPRVVKVLADRLWLAGRGRVEVSKSGALLLRGVLDAAVSDNARLIFSGGAACVAPLRQDRGPAVVLSDGGWLDSLRDVPDLSAKEAGEVAALIAQAKAAKAEEAGVLRAGHTERQVSRRAPVIAAKEGIPLEEAGERVRRAVEAGFAGELLADFELTVVHPDGRHEVVTVADVLSERQRYNEARCLCPLNPEHRDGSPDARLYLLSASPCLYDLDDSGQVFKLRGQRVRLQVAKGRRGDVVGELVAVCRASGEIFAGSTGEAVILSGGQAQRLDSVGLMNFIDTHVSLFQSNRRGDPVAWDLNRDVAELVLGALRRGGVPPLKGVMTTPYPTVSGRIVNREGYDDETGIFLVLPQGSDFSTPARGVSAAEVRSALGVMFAPFTGYRFADSGSAGAAVGSVFLALCRPVLDIAPGLVVDASTYGSGKTKFLTALGALGEGRIPGISVWSKCDEERKKHLLALARSGARSVLWDNVLGVVRSAALSGALSSGVMEGRILNLTDSVVATLRLLVGITGNNVSLNVDLLRKFSQIRIEAGDRPTARVFDFCPVAQALKQRQQIAEAACVVWRAYFEAGCPSIGRGDGGGWNAWNTLVRQVVLWLASEGLTDVLPFGEIGDPAEGMTGDHTSADGSEADAVLLQALKNLVEAKGTFGFTAREAFTWFKGGESKKDGDERDVWESLTEIRAGNQAPLTSQSLGVILNYRRDRNIGGLKLVGAPGQKATAVWNVV